MQTPKQLIRITTLALAAAMIIVSAGTLKATSVSTAALTFRSNGEVVGEGMTSTIIREPSGVTVNVHTNIEPGTYTVWLVIFNDPTRCINVGPSQCLPPPAGGPDIPDSLVFGSGQVVPSSGIGNFAVRLAVGDTDNVIKGREQLGLTDALGAEIYVVLRHHGSVLDDALEAQITTFGGGCDVNECEDLQAATHAPGAVTEEIRKLNELQALLARIAARLSLRP